MRKAFLILAFIFIFLLCGCSVDVSKSNDVLNNSKSENNSSATEDIEKPLVVDAVSIEKPIVPYNTDDDYFSDKTNKVILPKITVETSSAEEFNNSIFLKYVNCYNNLIQGKEESNLYDITYEWSVYNEIIIVFVNGNAGWQYSEWIDISDVFYFDIKKDREIDFDEYLSKLGLTKKELAKIISNTDEYKDFIEGNSEDGFKALKQSDILNSFLDKKSTIVRFNYSGIVSNLGRIEFPYSIIKK